MQAFAVRAHHHLALDPGADFALHRTGETQLAEDADALGADRVAGGLIAREALPVDEQGAQARAGEERRGGRAPRTATDDSDVESIHAPPDFAAAGLFLDGGIRRSLLWSSGRCNSFNQCRGNAAR